jgi:predicted amidohydrolase
MLSTDPADLFCQLYDRLEDRDVAEDRRWLQSDHLSALTAEVKAMALGLQLEPGWIEQRLREVVQRSGEGEQAACWAAARGLDRAFAHCNPRTAAPASTGRDRRFRDLIGDRYERLGRFDEGDEVAGVLLPKLTGTGRAGETTASRGQAFAFVHRVAPDIWSSEEVDFGPLGGRRDVLPATRDGRQGLVVACVPLLESLDELEVESMEVHGGNFFRARPCATDSLQERVRRVLARLDHSGAMLAVAPELALSTEVLDCWKRAILEEPRPRSALQWVFVGSGPLTEEDVDPPHNSGVLLDRITGEEIHRQDKLFPFTLMSDQMPEWGLADLFAGRAQVEEQMTRGRRLLIRESRWGRIAVLICEDLAKVLEDKVGRMVRGFGASLIVAPVFSKEVRAHYWEHSNAKIYADQVGTPTVVANSLVVPRAARQEGDVGTCLVHSNGEFKIGRSRKADQVSVFWLTTEGVEVPATHPVMTD